MNRETKIVIIAGLVIGFVAAIAMAKPSEIEPEFEDAEFIENLSNYEERP